jgi:hypothetical protein
MLPVCVNHTTQIELGEQLFHAGSLGNASSLTNVLLSLLGGKPVLNGQALPQPSEAVLVGFIAAVAMSELSRAALAPLPDLGERAGIHTWSVDDVLFGVTRLVFVWVLWRDWEVSRAALAPLADGGCSCVSTCSNCCSSVSRCVVGATSARAAACCLMGSHVQSHLTEYLHVYNCTPICAAGEDPVLSCPISITLSYLKGLLPDGVAAAWVGAIVGRAGELYIKRLSLLSTQQEREEEDEGRKSVQILGQAVCVVLLRCRAAAGARQPCTSVAVLHSPNAE